VSPTPHLWWPRDLAVWLEARRLRSVSWRRVAGHIIECGPQATGGNFAFFREIPGLEHPGFHRRGVEDGSSVITKHPSHGGRVSTETVTAQLLYEIGSPQYPNPDVTAQFDSINLSDDGPDRIRVSGVRGMPPPPTAKVSLNYEGGWRSTTVMYLTGLDIRPRRPCSSVRSGTRCLVRFLLGARTTGPHR